MISKGHAEDFMWSMVSSKVDKEMHSKWVSKAGGSKEIQRTGISGDLLPNPRYFVNKMIKELVTFNTGGF